MIEKKCNSRDDGGFFNASGKNRVLDAYSNIFSLSYFRSRREDRIGSDKPTHHQHSSSSHGRDWCVRNVSIVSPCQKRRREKKCSTEKRSRWSVFRFPMSIFKKKTRISIFFCLCVNVFLISHRQEFA